MKHRSFYGFNLIGIVVSSALNASQILLTLYGLKLGEHMKKLFLSASIAAILAAGSVQATEVYNKDGTTVDIGGSIGLKALQMKDMTETAEEKTATIGFENNSSRFNLGFGHDLGGGWKSMGLVEYAINMPSYKLETTQGNIETGTSPFDNRLAYLAFGHSTFGTLYVGKTWGTFSDVGAVTEVGAFYAPVWGVYGVDDGSWEGTGRAANVIQYRVTIPAANNLRLGLQYQPYAQTEIVDKKEVSKFGGGFGASLVAPIIPDLEFGVAYQMNPFEYDGDKSALVNAGTKYDKGAYALATSLKYGSFSAPGLHVAVSYAMGENLGALPETLSVVNAGLAGTTTGKLSATQINDNVSAQNPFASAPKANQIAAVASFNIMKVVPFVGYYMTTFESEADKRDIRAQVGGTSASPVFSKVKKATSNVLVAGLHYLWSDNFSIQAEFAMDMSSELTVADGVAALTDDQKKAYEKTNSNTGFTLGFKFAF